MKELKETNVLEVVQETEILGKKINLYESIENPLFKAVDVADWIDYSLSNITKMIKTVDEHEKTIRTFITSGTNYQSEAWFLTEDGLYEVCMQSRKPIAKKMKREIKNYLKSIRLTGASIVNEQKTVDYYFNSFSDDLKIKIFNELYNKNQELQQFYDDLLNTDGLMDMNTVAKELGIGEYKLFEYLRSKKVLYFNNFKNNVPYQRFCEENKFTVKETYCQDGKIRSVTYATKKGLDYIRKLLKKDNFYKECSL